MRIYLKTPLIAIKNGRNTREVGGVRRTDTVLLSRIKAPTSRKNCSRKFDYRFIHFQIICLKNPIEQVYFCVTRNSLVDPLFDDINPIPKLGIE
jgi:hypothetical protein